MATILDRELKRQISVDGLDYTVVLDPRGMRLIRKGKRLPEMELRWSDLLNGEAALAVALNASLSAKPGRRRETAGPKGEEKDTEAAARSRTR